MMNRVYTEEEKKPNIVSDKMCIKLLHIIFFCFFVFFPQMKFFKKLLYVLTFKKNILHQLDIIYFPMCINTLIWQYISLILEGPHQNATQNHPNDQEFFILCLPFSWNDFKKEHVHTFLPYMKTFPSEGKKFHLQRWSILEYPNNNELLKLLSYTQEDWSKLQGKGK